MCMDYFDHTTTTTGTTTTLKDTTPPQGTQQSISQQPQAHNNIQQQQQPIQPIPEKMGVNVANVQQGSNITSSPPQGPHSVVNNSNILPDSQQQQQQQQQTMIQQQNQQSPHVIQQQQLQNNLSEQDVINSSGLPNGNGTHYHVNHSHNVQGVNLSHVPPPSSVVTNSADPSAFNTTIPNHNPTMPSSGNTYQNSIPQQQQQQQQYYNNTGVMTG